MLKKDKMLVFNLLEVVGGYNDYNGKIEMITNTINCTYDEAETLLNEYLLY